MKDVHVLQMSCKVICFVHVVCIDGEMHHWCVFVHTCTCIFSISHWEMLRYWREWLYFCQISSHLFFFPCNFSHHLVSVVHRHLYRLHLICGVRNTMGACCMLCNLACHGGKIDSSTQSRAFVHLSTWEAETGRALKASERLCPFSVFRKTTLLNVWCLLYSFYSVIFTLKLLILRWPCVVDRVLKLMMAFSSLARTWREGLTILSPPAL